MLGNDVKRLAVQTHRANTSLLFVPFSISFFAQFYKLFEVTNSPITLNLSSKACRSNVIYPLKSVVIGHFYPLKSVGLFVIYPLKNVAIGHFYPLKSVKLFSLCQENSNVLGCGRR